MFLCKVNTVGTHMQMSAHTDAHTKSDDPYLRCPLSGLSMAHLAISNEFPTWEMEAIKREGMRRGPGTVCSLRPIKIRVVYNVHCPGHGHSPRPVSFLWHDHSHMPARNQRTTLQHPGRPDHLLSFSLSYLLPPSAIYHIFIMSTVSLDSARAVCLCISLFMHPLPPALESTRHNNHNQQFSITLNLVAWSLLY